ncbi:MAG: hypothetical protein ACM34L_13975, partial [Gemmatimonas sp.]
SYLGMAELQLGQIAQGVAEEHRGVDLEPQNPAGLTMMASAYVAAKMPDSATALARRLLALKGIAARKGMAAYTLGSAGERKEAQVVIHDLEALPENTWTRSSALALAYLGLNDTARAITYMERAAAAGDGDILPLYSSPLAIHIRRSARTDAVWRRYNLDPALLAQRVAALHQ